MKRRWLMPLGFLATILIGAVLLMLPCSTLNGEWMRPMDALFTACSAVCITGLTVIDPSADLSLVGQIVLMVLVQIGTVGIMTVGTFFLVMVGRRLSFSSEFSLTNAFGMKDINGLRSMVVWVVGLMIAIELLGTVALWFGWARNYESYSLAFHDGSLWYKACFYAIMGYCNAGFSLDPSSLACFQYDPFTLCTMAILVIIGGLGFLVFYNICTIQFWRRNLFKHGRISLHSKIMLNATFFFVLVTFIAIFLLEYSNTLADYSLGDKLSISFFQSVSPRTCGFTVVPVSEMHAVTRFLNGILMFIGAGPGSAGGGIKLTTFAVFVALVAAIYHGRSDVTIHRRTIAQTVVRESFVIFVLFAFVIALAMAILLATENGRPGLGFENLMFESISAVTTTGLSMDSTTRLLSIPGRFVIMACMFFGRLGAVTVVMLIAGKEDPPEIRYPYEEVVVG